MAPMNERNQTTLATEQTLFARLDALGIEHDTFRHQALHTVEESQAARGEMGESEGGHCKNLFLKDKKVVFWLFVTLEEKRVNMNVLQKTLGAARLSFGKPEFMKEYLPQSRPPTPEEQAIEKQRKGGYAPFSKNYYDEVFEN